jgi:hypothetical protein
LVQKRERKVRSYDAPALLTRLMMAREAFR